MDLENINSQVAKLTDMAIEYAPKLVLALILLGVGIWIINYIVRLMGKAMERSRISLEIQPFLKSMVGVLLKVMLIFSVAGVVGIDTTSFVAVMAAAGFAIGMALQGSLQNFAAGVMVLIFKPYKVGDIIDVHDQMGKVLEIQIFNTLIATFDNKTVIIPNSMAISDVITNLSAREYLRVELMVPMPYQEDFDKIERIVIDALHNTPGVLEDPAPFVGIHTFDSHSIQLAVWPHAKTDDYWDVYFAAQKNVKAALRNNGIKVAYSEGIELGDM